MKNEIENFLTLSAGKVVAVHSDVTGVIGAVPRQENMDLWLAGHIQLLEEVCAPVPIIFPTFNYQFLETGLYRVDDDNSEVGALSEYARKNWATWRSNMPVFNYVGSENSQPLNEQLKVKVHDSVDPFDEYSIFHYLYENNGTFLMYGAPFSSFTGIHHIEHLAGRPLYRYDKCFKGKVLSTEKCEVTLRYHVRPQGLNLNYCWNELLELSKEKGIVKEFNHPRVHILAFSYKELADFWLEHIKNDPLFLLDKQSRKACEAILKKLDRRFIQSDFEDING